METRSGENMWQIIHLSGHPSLLGTMGDDSTSLGGKDWRGWAVGADTVSDSPGV